ncbi:MAG: ATP-dependent protease ATPase subunit HslU [Candidatus Coatesbacteria bacterium]|nr:ATP-dependent protease ATPase subunit HslU [Candidatus Coatesbacteria bacterium]
MTINLLPRQIVEALDNFIVGQKKAKKAVAVAIRNRWRRLRVTGRMQDEITPNNILLIGPTGVGKTEIARRLADLVGAPFIKVEASKFTEVGYVGRDVETMVRDLLEIAINMIKSEKTLRVELQARENAYNRVLDKLIPSSNVENEERRQHTRERLREKLIKGELDLREIEIEQQVSSKPSFEIFSNQGMEEMGVSLGSIFDNIMPKKTKITKKTVAQAIAYFTQEESQKLVDMESVIEEAKELTQHSGIIFIDEIDKVVGSSTDHGPDVSRGGVQRDLLPIIEGCSVTTKYGMINTKHILFIAAGAFHINKPSDLLPELQGRLPIRVEMDSLSEDDFIRILNEPENALTKQYKELLLTEGIELEFEEDAIREIAKIAAQVNREVENIGARRLQTILAKVLEPILFEIPKDNDRIVITKNCIDKTLSDFVINKDLSRYIL